MTGLPLGTSVRPVGDLGLFAELICEHGHRIDCWSIAYGERTLEYWTAKADQHRAACLVMAR